MRLVIVSDTDGQAEFQSTHPNGVRPGTELQSTPSSSFNPRTRKGATIHDIDLTVYNVSTRTRAGYNHRHHGKRDRESRFNPRTRTGCDISETIPTTCGCMFQSTHPHGVRPLPVYRPSYSLPVQSTHPHGGATIDTPLKGRRRSVLIHAPHGVRPVSKVSMIRGWKFQSTHPQGVRQPKTRKKQKPLEFQSTHPYGVRRHNSRLFRLPMRFNPRTPHGVRQYISKGYVSQCFCRAVQRPILSSRIGYVFADALGAV